MFHLYSLYTQEWVILLQRNLHCLEENFLFELPFQDILLCCLKLQLWSFPQLAKTLLLTVLCQDKLQFSREHKCNEHQLQMQVTFPLHTLRQTAWTKYNAIQVWMKSAICNCKERLKKEKKKERSWKQLSLSLSDLTQTFCVGSQNWKPYLQPSLPSKNHKSKK